jgi:4-amino-4-deoxy-L-arabinose transferase-like glycosyltransferase
VNPASHAVSPSKFLSRASILGILALTWLVIYVPGLFRPALLDDVDSEHAEASREMLLNHDWVTLYIDGVRYLQKAPLLHWMNTVSYELFGVSEWQTRLPLALCVLGLMCLAYAFGRRIYGIEAGFYAAIILATSPAIYIFTRFQIPDVLVALLLALAMYLFWIACEQEQPSRWICWALAVTIALNVLTKSLIGLVFPAMIVGVYLFLTGRVRKLRTLHLWSSSLVFLAVAAPWHILAAIRNPAQPTGPEKGFLWFYFMNEQFLRYLNKRIPYDYDKVPLWLFWSFLLIWLIPWCVFLFPALKEEIPTRFRSWRDGLDRRGRANLLLGTWAAVIMVFFSFSSRQEYYSLPVLPALALLIAGWLQRENESEKGSPQRRAGRIASAVLLAIGFVAFVITLGILSQTHSFPPDTDIGEVLTSHPGHYKLSLGHMQDLTIESFGLFRTPLWEIGIALLLGTGLNWVFRRRGSPFKGNLALTGMMVVVLFCIYQGYVIFSPELSSKDFALAIQKVYQPGETIVINRDYEWGSTLNFYTGIQVHLLNGRRADMWFGSLFPDAPRIFEDNVSFAQLWYGPNRVYLFSQEFFKEEALKEIDPNTVHVFARQGGKIVLTNRPLGATAQPTPISLTETSPAHP